MDAVLAACERQRSLRTAEEFRSWIEATLERICTLRGELNADGAVQLLNALAAKGAITATQKRSFSDKLSDAELGRPVIPTSININVAPNIAPQIVTNVAAGGGGGGGADPKQVRPRACTPRACTRTRACASPLFPLFCRRLTPPASTRSRFSRSLRYRRPTSARSSASAMRRTRPALLWRSS